MVPYGASARVWISFLNARLPQRRWHGVDVDLQYTDFDWELQI